MKFGNARFTLMNISVESKQIVLQRIHTIAFIVCACPGMREENKSLFLPFIVICGWETRAKLLLFIVEIEV